MLFNELWEILSSGKPFFIAEAGVNHLGSLELGERLIKEASESGANAIKFQSYKAKNLCTKNAPRFWDWEGELEKEGSQFDSYSHLDSFGEKEHHELKKLCDKYEIEFMSTPFDDEATDYLDRIGINAYKIASCDLTNHPLLKRVASKKKIMMLSTGAAKIDEIKESVRLIREFGTDKIVIMHCNLKYPTGDDEINLRMINDIRNSFPDCLIGLSDHTMNLWTPAFAHALGASVIEKHFTVDKTLGKSADHWLSVDPNDVRQLMKNLHFAEILLGRAEKECTESEQKAKLYARRSIVSLNAIAKGDMLTKNNLTCKRPGTGLSPTMLESLIGKKARKDIPEDHIISLEDIYD